MDRDETQRVRVVGGLNVFERIRGRSCGSRQRRKAVGSFPCGVVGGVVEEAGAATAAAPPTGMWGSSEFPQPPGKEAFP